VKRLLAAAGLGAVVVWLALPGSPAYACSCAAVPLRAQLAGADAVFTARVTTVHREDDELLARAKVERVYKGDPGADVALRTTSSSAACGIAFSRGARYLVFARSEGASYRTSLCNGTTDDVAVLDRAGYSGHEQLTVVAARSPAAGHPSRTAPIAAAGCALGAVFAVHARRFARS
jgi:hypothetical protein